MILVLLQDMKILISLFLAVAACAMHADACTSVIVSARASATGRPLLWKHRDTGAPGNFVARVPATDTTTGYTVLFNDGDSLMTEAWMGMNDTGFAIMNTASYNLAPDTARLKDREGAVMTLALGRCATVDDFGRMLDSLPRPMGVQANFGVIDACGGAAYFETDDGGFRRFDVADDPRGYMIRTNYSVSGVPGEGMGYIRHVAAEHLTDSIMRSRGGLAPESFTEGLSRSFFHGLTLCDHMAAGCRYVTDTDFIPRDISTSSIVIEGVNSPAEASDMNMWTALGYPPVAAVGRVTLDSIPEGMGADAQWTSPLCRSANAVRDAARPFKGGSGRKYLNLWLLHDAIADAHRRSMEVYNRR